MSRLQLALNVSDLDSAIDFYSKLFATEPHKIKPGYANFAITEPPLKLVLFESPAAPGTINHLGVEVESVDDVAAATARLAAAGMATDERTAEVCCYAQQDKVWVDGPDATRWEVYAITDDAPAQQVPQPGGVGGFRPSGQDGCCSNEAAAEELQQVGCC